MNRPSNYVSLCDMLSEDLRIQSRRLGKARRYIEGLIQSGDEDFKDSCVKWGKGYSIYSSNEMKEMVRKKLAAAGLLRVRIDRVQGISKDKYDKILSIPTVDITAALQGISDSPLWLKR